MGFTSTTCIMPFNTSCFTLSMTDFAFFGSKSSVSNAAFILARTWANCPYFIPMLDMRADEVYCRERYFSHSSCLMVKPVTVFTLALPVRTRA